MQIIKLMKTKGGKKNPTVTTILLMELVIAYLRKNDFKVLPEVSSGFRYLSYNA